MSLDFSSLDRLFLIFYIFQLGVLKLESIVHSNQVIVLKIKVLWNRKMFLLVSILEFWWVWYYTNRRKIHAWKWFFSTFQTFPNPKRQTNSSRLNTAICRVKFIYYLFYYRKKKYFLKPLYIGNPVFKHLQYESFLFET